MNSKVKDLVKISIFCFFNLPSLMSLESKDLELRPFRIKLTKYTFYAQHANVLVPQPFFDKVPLYSRCIAHWLKIHRNPPVSASQVPGLKAFATPSSLGLFIASFIQGIKLY